MNRRIEGKRPISPIQKNLIRTLSILWVHPIRCTSEFNRDALHCIFWVKTVNICNMFKYKGKVMSCKLFTSIDHMTPVGSWHALLHKSNGNPDNQTLFTTVQSSGYKIHGVIWGQLTQSHFSVWFNVESRAKMAPLLCVLGQKVSKAIGE